MRLKTPVLREIRDKHKEASEGAERQRWGWLRPKPFGCCCLNGRESFLTYAPESIAELRPLLSGRHATTCHIKTLGKVQSYSIRAKCQQEKSKNISHNILAYLDDGENEKAKKLCLELAGIEEEYSDGKAWRGLVLFVLAKLRELPKEAPQKIEEPPQKAEDQNGPQTEEKEARPQEALDLHQEEKTSPDAGAPALAVEQLEEEPLVLAPEASAEEPPRPSISYEELCRQQREEALRAFREAPRIIEEEDQEEEADDELPLLQERSGEPGLVDGSLPALPEDDSLRTEEIPGDVPLPLDVEPANEARAPLPVPAVASGPRPKPEKPRPPKEKTAMNTKPLTQEHALSLLRMIAEGHQLVPLILTLAQAGGLLEVGKPPAKAPLSLVPTPARTPAPPRSAPNPFSPDLISQIKSMVCRAFGIKERDFTHKSNAIPRWVCWWLHFHLAEGNLSQSKVAQAWGHKQDILSYAFSQMRKKLANEPDFKTKVDALLEELKGEASNTAEAAE